MTVTADSKTIIENLAKRGNRHAVWALAEMDRLTAELAAARGHYNMTAAILSEFRFGNRIMYNCVSCDRETEWFRQMTDDGGINYCTVCGYSPEEQAEAIPF